MQMQPYHEPALHRQLAQNAGGGSRLFRGGDPSADCALGQGGKPAQLRKIYSPCLTRSEFGASTGEENITAIEFIYCNVDFKDVLKTVASQLLQTAFFFACCSQQQWLIAATATRPVLWQLKEAIAHSRRPRI